MLAAGFELLRSKGSHRIYGKGVLRVTVPFHSGAVLQGSLGIHLDSGGQNLTTEENMTFVGWQRFEIELDCLLDVCESLFKRVPLRLTPLQFGTPSVETVLLSFDNDTRLAGPEFSVSPPNTDHMGVFSGVKSDNSDDQCLVTEQLAQSQNSD